MAWSKSILHAGRILRAGGVIAYPTEGVFGLGCLPYELDAVARILTIKQRDPGLGLILIASDASQLEGWAELPDGTNLDTSGEHPVTWIVPALAGVPRLLRGDHAGLAVRLTQHPVAAALCDAVNSPLVSTSANLHGRPPARSRHVVRKRFGRLVDYVVPGDCGAAAGPSEIRDLATGKVLRSA